MYGSNQKVIFSDVKTPLSAVSPTPKKGFFRFPLYMVDPGHDLPSKSGYKRPHFSDVKMRKKGNYYPVFANYGLSGGCITRTGGNYPTEKCDMVWVCFPRSLIPVAGKTGSRSANIMFMEHERSASIAKSYEKYFTQKASSLPGKHRPA